VSALEEALWLQITADPALPWPEREFRFAPPRRWRWDFSWEPDRLAVEVQGARWKRHGEKRDQSKSFEKLNEAALLGWKVLQVNAEMIADGTALELIRRALAIT
jgi:hypothetical protein